MNVSSVALTGLNRAQSAFESAAKKIGGTSGDTVDLSTEAVNLIGAKDSYQANIGVLKAADEMDRSALSLLG